MLNTTLSRSSGKTDTPVDWLLCSAITREHGRTFYLASHFQTPPRRRALHAIYAYCRIADDIVDRAATPDEAAVPA